LDRNRSLLSFLTRSHLPCLATRDTNTPSLSLCWTCNSALPTTVTFHPAASATQLFLSADRFAIRRSLNMMKVPSRFFRNHKVPDPYRPKPVPVSVPDRCTLRAPIPHVISVRTETLQRSPCSRDCAHNGEDRTSFARAPGERNDHPLAVMQLDADLTVSVRSDLPSIFKRDPSVSLQRALRDLDGIELDEKSIGSPHTPQGPNAIAADHMAAKSPRHFVPAYSIHRSAKPTTTAPPHIAKRVCATEASERSGSLLRGPSLRN
jgi:hypothetical protein